MSSPLPLPSAGSVAVPWILDRAQGQRRGVAAGVASAFNAVVYLGANHYPRVVPQQLPLSAIDRLIPFWPQTVWLYASDYLLLLITFLVIVDERKALRFLAAYSLAGGLAALIHWGVPIGYPRELYSHAGLAGATGWAIATYRALDTASSCMPSVHVAGAALAASYLRREARWAHRLGLLWAVAICASTLTTKQHYAVDVAGGLLLWWVVRRLVPPVPLAALPPANGRAAGLSAA